LSENDFWKLTPREFNALTERYKEAKTWLDYRAALICSVMANIWRDPKRKRTPFSPDEFMPETGAAKSIQTPQQIFNTVQMLNTIYGGEVRER